MVERSLADLMKEQARLWRRSRQLYELERDMEDHLSMYEDYYRSRGHLGARYVELQDRISQMKNENTILQKLTSSQMERYLCPRNEVSREIGDRLHEHEHYYRGRCAEDTRWARLEREITKFDLDQRRRFRDFRDLYIRKLYLQMDWDYFDFAPRSDWKYLNVHRDKAQVSCADIHAQLDEAIARALMYDALGDLNRDFADTIRMQMRKEDAYRHEQSWFERDEDKDYDESQNQMENEETCDGDDHMRFRPIDKVANDIHRQADNDIHRQADNDIHHQADNDMHHQGDSDEYFNKNDQLGEEGRVSNNVKLQNQENFKAIHNIERETECEFSGNSCHSIKSEKDSPSTGNNTAIPKQTTHGTDCVQRDVRLTGSDQPECVRTDPSAVSPTGRSRKSNFRRRVPNTVQNKLHEALGEQIIAGLKRNLNERLNPQCSARPGSVLTRTGHYRTESDTRYQYDDERYQRERKREASTHAARAGVVNSPTKYELLLENRMEQSRLKRSRSAQRKDGKTFLYTPEERDTIVKNVKRCFMKEIPFCIYSNHQKRYVRR